MSFIILNRTQKSGNSFTILVTTKWFHYFFNECSEYDCYNFYRNY